MISVEQQVVRSAIDMLKPRGAWIQRFYARVSDGRLCYVEDPHACKFCASAAIQRAAWLKGVSPDPIHDKFVEIYGVDIPWFNDQPKRRKRDVILALERVYDAL